MSHAPNSRNSLPLLCWLSRSFYGLPGGGGGGGVMEEGASSSLGDVGDVAVVA